LGLRLAYSSSRTSGYSLFYRSYRTKTGSPVLQGLVRYQFDDDGIRLFTPHSQADVKWPAFIKWKEGKNTFFTYQTPKIGNVIPKRFFQNPTDIDAVRTLMRTHIRPKKN
ncbi:MAG: YcxB family protein, partial [Candidatus Sulfotelmatobacter sp.]